MRFEPISSWPFETSTGYLVLTIYPKVYLLISLA